MFWADTSCWCLHNGWQADHDIVAHCCCHRKAKASIWTPYRPVVSANLSFFRILCPFFSTWNQIPTKRDVYNWRLAVSTMICFSSELQSHPGYKSFCDFRYKAHGVAYSIYILYLTICTVFGPDIHCASQSVAYRYSSPTRIDRRVQFYTVPGRTHFTPVSAFSLTQRGLNEY